MSLSISVQPMAVIISDDIIGRGVTCTRVVLKHYSIIRACCHIDMFSDVLYRANISKSTKIFVWTALRALLKGRDSTILIL